MHQSAQTTEGKPVLSGVFALVGTHGVPLELILMRFQQEGWVVDWPDYVAGAMKDGHKPRTIRARILAAVSDVYGPVYGPAYAEEVGRRLDRPATGPHDAERSASR